jgi:lipopolysaccharide biosynthesis protein
MTDEKSYTENESHRKFAVDIFNAIWRLLQKNDRTADDDEAMLQMAHASCYHWSKVGAAINQARGEWMISHVNTILKRSEAALHHARRSLTICEKNAFGDFDIAYAYEALARAYALNRDRVNFAKFRALAEGAGAQIKEKEDRNLFSSDLAGEPWFGMK